MQGPRSDRGAAAPPDPQWERRVLDALFAFVGLLATDGTLLDANRAPLDAAGLSLDDVRGRHFADCYWWSHSEKVQERLRGAITRAARGETVRYDEEIRTAGDGRMVIDFQLVPLRDGAGRITHLIPSGVDVTQRVEAERRNRLQASLLDAVEQAVIATDLEGRITHWNRFAESLYGWPEAEVLGRSIMDVTPGSQSVEQANAIMASLVAGRSWSGIFEVRARDGREFPAYVIDAPIHDESGRLVGIIGVSSDISEWRRVENQQRLLMAELDHRAKNMLAAIQAILRLTRADAIATYREAIEGRIAALVRAHDLLSEAKWRGAEIDRLIREEVEPFRPGEDGICIAGPQVGVPPAAAQALSLVFHELATNAAKYGALSVPSGRLDVRWEASDGRVTLTWRETGGPPPRAAPSRGFGTTLIETTLAHGLDGSARLDYRPEGLACRLEFRIPRDEG